MSQVLNTPSQTDSPVSRTEINSRLLKTKICSLYLEGRCFYGTRCFYAHDVGELVERPNLAKTSICKAFRAGMCTQGESCKFAHSVMEMRESSKSITCLWWQRGHCTHGSRCRFAHCYTDKDGVTQKPNMIHKLVTDSHSARSTSADEVGTAVPGPDHFMEGLPKGSCRSGTSSPAPTVASSSSGRSSPCLLCGCMFDGQSYSRIPSEADQISCCEACLGVLLSALGSEASTSGDSANGASPQVSVSNWG